MQFSEEFDKYLSRTLKEAHIDVPDGVRDRILQQAKQPRQRFKYLRFAMDSISIILFVVLLFFLLFTREEFNSLFADAIGRVSLIGSNDIGAIMANNFEYFVIAVILAGFLIVDHFKPDLE